MLPETGGKHSFPRYIFDLMTDSLAELFGDKPFVNTTPLSVVSKDDEYVVELPIPGFEKSDLRLTLDENVLEISAERKGASVDDDGLLAAQEPDLSFKRTYLLPNDAIEESIRATFTGGVLRVTFKKRIVTK